MSEPSLAALVAFEMLGYSGVYLHADGSVTGTATQTWNFGATAGGLRIAANAGVAADYRFGRYVSGSYVDRWMWRMNSDAESTANAGSNAELLARADDGSAVGIAMQINRATRVVNFPIRPTYAGGALALVSEIVAGYTDEQAQDALASMIAAGSHTGITFSYNDAGNALSASVTAEFLMDTIAAMIAAGTATGMTVTYNDAGDSLSFAATGTYTNENAMDAIAAMIAAGTHTGITFTYNDAGDALSAIVAITPSETIAKTYPQSLHGFSEGMPIKKGSSVWVQSDRDSPTTTAAGLVSAVDAALVSDPSFSSVVSVMNFGGVHNSTTFSDPIRAWTANGNAKIDTSLGVNYGLFDGSGDALTSTGAGLALSNVYTIEAYVKKTNAGDYGTIFAQISGGYDGCQFRVTATGIEFNTYNGGGGTTFTRTFTPDTAEHHIEIDCNGTNLWAYIDGVLLGAASGSQTIGNSTGTLNIGQDWSGSSWDLDGRIRGFRITKACRHPNGTTFTPPTLPLPEAAGSGFSEFTLVQLGPITLTTGQWDARTGLTGGLPTGSEGYLSSTAGGITFTKPSSGIVQPLGRAESPTVFRVEIGTPYPGMTAVTVASLPSAATMGAGFTAYVSDALTPVSGSTVVGGGAVKRMVISDATNWIVV